jgi:hypothetical protein
MAEQAASPTLTYRVALVVLCLAAGFHLVVLAKEWAAEPSSNVDHMAFVTCLWALVIWKVGTRAWGRGVGVMMMVMGGSVLHLWWVGGGMCRGTIGVERDLVHDLQYLPYEAVLLVTGFVCVLLPRSPSRRDAGTVDAGGGGL